MGDGSDVSAVYMTTNESTGDGIVVSDITVKNPVINKSFLGVY